MSALSNMLPGGGDGVNANAQIGAENTQAVVSQSEDIEIGDSAAVDIQKADTVNEIAGTQINHNDLPWWVWVLIGWMVPTPARIICDNIQDMRNCRKS